MRQIDVKCEAEQAEDGSFTIIISVDQLTFPEAQRIASETADPFRKIVHSVLSKDGELPLTTRNLLEKPQ